MALGNGSCLWMFDPLVIWKTHENPRKNGDFVGFKVGNPMKHDDSVGFLPIKI
jgi:hypothetical protein